MIDNKITLNAKQSFIVLLLIATHALYPNTGKTIIAHFPGDGLFFPANDIHQIASAAMQRLGYTYIINNNIYPLPDDHDTLHAIIISNPVRVKEITQKNYPPKKLVTYLWEPPAVHAEQFRQSIYALSDIVFTWDDDLVDNKKFFKLTYPQLPSFIVEPLPFHQKKFCCIMAGNYRSHYAYELYSARRTTIRFFEKHAPDKLDLYGRCWGTNYKTYKKYAPSKLTTLRNYKFLHLL